MGSITHKVRQIQYWECLMTSIAIMPFERVYKMRYIMNSRKTSLKLKHQKNKVNYKEMKLSITLHLLW
jgi:hypothetical protein